MTEHNVESIQKGFEVLRAERAERIKTLQRAHRVAHEVLLRYPDGISQNALIAQIVEEGPSREYDAGYAVWNMFNTESGNGLAVLDTQTGVIRPRTK